MNAHAPAGRRRRSTFRRTGWLAVAALTLAALFATPGVALGHHADVFASLDCEGKVSYTVNDWADGYAATFDISYAVDGSASYTLVGPAAFTAGNDWTVTGSFTVSTSVTSVVVRVNGFVWANGTNAPGPWYSSPATRPTDCKASPVITTVASPSMGMVGVPMTVSDTATLTGGNSPSGSVTFTLYSDSECETSTGVTGSGTISSGSATYSQGWTPAAAGTFYWKATYGGDNNNNGFTECGGQKETVVVTDAPRPPTCVDLGNCPTPTPTPVVTPTPTPVVTPTPTPVVTPTPSGEVAAATATPRVTPPPTDTLPTGGTPSGGSLAIVFLAIAGLLATIRFLTPATPAKARRRR